MSILKQSVKLGSSLFCAMGLVSAVAFLGCGDDSSSNPSGTAPAISSAVVNYSSAEAPLSSADGVPASSDAQGVVGGFSSASEDVFVGFVTTPGTLALTPDVDGFYDMGDVYNAVPTTSKIAFVIRHSKREKKNTSQESLLTPIGIEMAQTLGKKLAGGDASFHYASTDFVRTRETCRNIAIGRGETDVQVETWDGIDGGYFLTVPVDTLDAVVSRRGGNNKYIAQWAYGLPFSPALVGEMIKDYFYDFYSRGNQFINEVMVPNMANWSRVSILVSHDLLLEPLIVFVSNRTIDLYISGEANHWVNYLSGIAVIIDESNAVTVLPVRGDSVGWMSPRAEVVED